MPISNLNNEHLSAEQLTTAKSNLATLEETLALEVRNLNVDDRKRYGSINEQNKLFVNKIHDYASGQPSLKSPDVDWAEFENDFNSRQELEQLIARLERLTTGLKNAKILHDFDNFQAALDDYAYTSYKAGTMATGFENKYLELKQFFTRSKKNTTTQPDTPKNDA